MTKLIKCDKCDHYHPKTHMIRIYDKEIGLVEYICGIKCSMVTKKVICYE